MKRTRTLATILMFQPRDPRLPRGWGPAKSPAPAPPSALPPVAEKAARLHVLKPGAAAVVEEIVDSLLGEAHRPGA